MNTEAYQNEPIARVIARKRIQQELYGLDDVPISSLYTLVNADIAHFMMPRRSRSKRSRKRSLSSNRTSNNEKNKKQKLVVPRIVSFSPKKLVKQISNLNSMPDRVIADRWYRSGDYYKMKLSCKHISCLVENENGSGTIIDEEKETKRGLEGWTKSGARERLKCRRDAYSVVFNEQHPRWNNKFKDPYRLSVLYKECSKKSIMKALKMAEEDEECIQEYLADTRMDELKRMEMQKLGS